MIRTILFLLSFFVCAFAHAQQEEAWVYLSEKTNTEAYFDNPLTMLSQRALDRRIRQGIALDVRDVPLDAVTVSEVSNTVRGDPNGKIQVVERTSCSRNENSDSSTF